MNPLALPLIAHDVIEDEEGRLKVIDTIGSACTLVVTRKAAYSPRSARLHRFFELLERRLPGLKEGRPIVWFDHGVPGSRFVLPASVAAFYRALPPGVARLGWLAAARRQMERRQAKPPHELLHAQEHRELARVARQRGLELIEAAICERPPGGGLTVYPARGGWPRTLEPGEVGLLLSRWGFAQPESPPAPLPARLPVCNHPLVDFALERAKWVFRTLATAGRPDLSGLFPRETFVGMGCSGAQEVADLAARLKEPAAGMPAAVLKPLATHAGLDVTFLSRQALEALCAQVAAMDGLAAATRKAVRAALERPFPYTGDDFLAGAFIWDVSRGPGQARWRDLRWAQLELAAEGKRHWLAQAAPGGGALLTMHHPPLVELASYILQEFVTARPVVSRRSGHPQRGYLRALFLGAELVAAVYRFARQEAAGFTNLADAGVPTFFEPAPPRVEERLEAELGPLNASFLAALRPYLEPHGARQAPEGALRLSRDMLRANFFGK